MKKVLASLLLVVLMTLAIAPAFAVTEYYSCCPNGKPLNVRQYPSKQSAKIGEIKYGDKIGVDHIANGWACIVWGSVDGYVQASLMSRNYPGTKPSGNTNTNTGSSASYKNFVFTNYTGIVTPSRATGTVTLYWNPNTKGTKMAVLTSGTQVQVLATTNTWVQVYDEDNNMCGFMLKKYVVQE